ncbi:zinc finger MYM-type protein 1-like [Chrysemys picta bellii]|uniref:zinc finger MYM-type protein 1-like n=1 Tax=Chrysemys picta bellii TaxID=8478 RepID=UPI0032B21160
MKEHLRKITDHETQVHYLGKNMQNELIQILANAIKNKIVEAAHSGKYFSIILDGTPDVSHVEQMMMIFLIVDMKKSADEDNVEVLIKKHFLGFVPLTETTGAFMAETILQELEIVSLSVENLCGQGYDKGSNMKGKDNGVQRRMMEINPSAVFIPCSAHSLNLVVNDAASCLEASSFFDLVQGVYVFFSGEILTCHVNSLTVKSLSQTRWENPIDALKPLCYELGNIYDALIEISDDTTFTGSSGNMAHSDAEALANGLSKFKFVTSLILWHNILFEINLTSKQLQEKNLNIHSAIQKLQQTKNILEEFRSDERFKRTLVDSLKLAEEIDFPTEFEPEPVHIRQKK